MKIGTKVLLGVTLVCGLATAVLMVAAILQKTWVVKSGVTSTLSAGLTEVCDNVFSARVYCTDKSGACYLSEKSDVCVMLKGGFASAVMSAIAVVCVVTAPLVYMVHTTFKNERPGKLFKNILFIGLLALSMALQAASLITWGASAKNFINNNSFSVGGGFYTYLTSFIFCILNLVSAIFM